MGGHLAFFPQGATKSYWLGLSTKLKCIWATDPADNVLISKGRWHFFFFFIFQFLSLWSPKWLLLLLPHKDDIGRGMGRAKRKIGGGGSGDGEGGG